MFEALAERLLNKILGQYIQNFSSENLKIGIWSGQIILKNIVLKKEIIKKLNLPFKIKYSFLGTLKMNIPWKSLTSSKIEVLLQGLELILTQIPVAQWECKNTKIIEKRKKQIEELCESITSDFAKKAEKTKQSDDGYFSKLIVKIIDNLQVTIKDIHIRYEDDAINKCSFGVTLQQFRLYTVNYEGIPQYIDRSKSQYCNEPLRKRLELYNLGIYWNQKSQFYSDSNCKNKMNSTIAKRNDVNHTHHYVILLNCQAKLLQLETGKQFKDPQINLQVNLQTLKIEITNNQLQQMINLGQRLQKYTKRVKEQNSIKLSKQQMKENINYFNNIFPQYYKDFGKSLPEASIKKIDNIFQKMEVQNFKPDILNFLQEKQKQRIIKQKTQKNKSWWFGKPKQLSQQELNGIQDYLNDNFGKEVSIVKRPENYSYIKLKFRLHKLQVVIANTLAIIKQGIQSTFDNLEVNLQLRQGGSMTQISLQNISISMFKQIGIEPRVFKSILYKVQSQGSKLSETYLQMVIIANPLDKKYLNTDIRLVTSQIMIVFDPKIISIAVDFAKLNINKENRQIAMETYGQIVQKASQTVLQSMQKPVKKQIGVDVIINSIFIVVPFVPSNQSSHCWALNLGKIHFTTDQQTLRRTEASLDLPLDVFNFELKNLSFKHYQNLNQVNTEILTKNYKNIQHAVLDDLDLKLRLQTYHQASDKIAKVKLNASFPSINVKLNTFTYSNLLTIGKSFQQDEVLQNRMTSRIDEKKEIQSKASKIGFVHIKDSITKMWKKYVAIMHQNYIYLYINKNDQEYSAYYYIKGASLHKQKEPLDKQKPYHLKIKNKINEVIFGFDKDQQSDDWIIKIKALEKEIQQKQMNSSFIKTSTQIKSQNKKQIRHNDLTLIVEASIDKLALEIYCQKNNKINLTLNRIQSKVLLFQSKKLISLKLYNIELIDDLLNYKYKQFQYFLQTRHTGDIKHFISVDIQQMDKNHPEYQKIDSKINVFIGTLICNYKCETVKALMKFFIPEESGKIQQIKPQSQLMPSIQSTLLSFIFEQEQFFSLKLKVQIQDVAIVLINSKTKNALGKLGISDFLFMNNVSQKRTVLEGSLRQLYYKDFSNYPQTIYQQTAEYNTQRSILANRSGNNQNMLQFKIQLLKKFNNQNKNLLINIILNNVTINYVQQPVLRIITYLNTQMLPSFQTGSKEVKKIVINDGKPEISPMQLIVNLYNISVYVETQHIWETQKAKERQQYMFLNIQSIKVKNSSVYRKFIQPAIKEQDSVLVQNYEIQLNSIAIIVRYFNKTNIQNSYELTNKMNVTTSIDLIANPEYYKKQYKKQFKNGLRLKCHLSPFVLKINHDDYNFIMKCLNWSITHDDGLESILFDLPQEKQNLEVQNKEEKVPFYMNIEMDYISLFVTQKSIPILFLLLDKVMVIMGGEETSQIMVSINDLKGSSIEYKQQQKTILQKGMFNSLGYYRQFSRQQIKDLSSYINKFSDFQQRKDLQNKKKFLVFTMHTNESQNCMQIKLADLCLDVDIKLLMILTNLANLDEEYTRGPKSMISKKLKKLNQINHEQEKQMVPAQPAKKMILLCQIDKILCSVSDRKKQKFVIIQLSLSFSMLNYGDKKTDEIRQYLTKNKRQSLAHSQMRADVKKFTLYFCKIKDEDIYEKRQFLKPMSIFFQMMKDYKTRQKFIILNTQISLMTQQLLLSASIKDMINVNYIFQENMKILAQTNDNKQEQTQLVDLKLNQKQSSLASVQDSISMQQSIKLKEIQKEALQQMQTNLRIKGKIKPIQVEIINDCDNNFMPVFRLLIQQTQPFMHKYLIKNHLTISPVISLHFFNPRSSKWEPIIESFKLSLDYLVLTSPEGDNVKLLFETDATNEKTGSLKINISTQMVSTLLAAKEIAYAEKQNIEKNIQVKQIEVSPIIFENFTNQRVFLSRGDKEIEIAPLFKGPLKIQDDQQIKFRICNKPFTFSLNHYGVLRIPQTQYLIKFDTMKLNRVICFMPTVIIKNCLLNPFYIKRFGNNISEVPRKVQISDIIPLDGVDQFCISLNGSSYSQKVNSNNITTRKDIMAQKKNFILLLKHKKKGKYSIMEVTAPFIINNCLPKGFNLQFIKKAKTVFTKPIEQQSTHQVYSSDPIPSLQFKLLINGYSWSKKFKYTEQQQLANSESKFEVDDQDNARTVLNFLFNKQKQTNQYVLSIYCRAIITNQLAEKLIVYGNSKEDEKAKKTDRYSLLGGQDKDNQSFDDKIILIGDEVGNKIRVCGAKSMIDFATPIAIGGLGSAVARIAVDRVTNGKQQSMFSKIGVDISAVKMIKGCDVICKRITLKNKSVVINGTNRDITILEENSQFHQSLLKAKSKQSFVFGLPMIGNYLGFIFKIKGYNNSKVVHMPDQGITYFQINKLQQINQNQKDVISFKIYAQTIQSYKVFEISELQQQQFPYEIQVKAQDLKVEVPYLKKEIQKGNNTRFILNKNLNENIQMQLIIHHKYSSETIKLKVSPDDLKYKEKSLLKIKKEGLTGSIPVTVEVTICDYKRIIVIDQLHHQEDPKQIQKNYLLIHLSEIVLSINQNSQNIQRPFESMVMTFRRLAFIKNQTDKKIEYQLKIGFFQIDQAYPYVVSNPVVLTPSKFQQFTRVQQPKYIFNSVIVISKQFTQNLFIKQISIDFDDIVTTFNIEFLNLLTDLIKEYSQVLNFKPIQYKIKNETQTWKDLVIPKSPHHIYIKSIQIAPFVIDLSAQLNIKKLNLENNILLETILSTVGIVISNIDNATIEMTGISIDDCIDTLDSISNQLIAHYKQTCIRQLYKIFGSLNIIGNPLSLFRNISTGFKDLTQKPAQGLVKGPAQFGLGIAQGTSSLVTHSVGGAFNSLSKVTGTVSTGLATLAFDNQFQEHRQKQKMKKPQNVLQGLQKGGKAILYGFKQGITGIFTQPYQSARKEGALGFFKGAAKGVAGLVIKPVTGIIDFASKTTQGIKNNVLMFEDKANQNRMRYPRIFYTECFILKQYCQIDSQLFFILNKLANDDKFQDCIFIDSFAAENGLQYLIILLNRIVCVNVEKNYVLWSITFENLAFENYVNKKCLHFRKINKTGGLFASNQFDFVVQSDQTREHIMALIGQIQKSVEQNK